MRRAVFYAVFALAVGNLGVPTAMGSPKASAGVAGPVGRPKVELNQLEFPPGVERAAFYQAYLRKVLARETRRADWGAGYGSTIQYRFRVDKLEFERNGNLLQITCSATGSLPKNKAARSKLSFTGDARNAEALVKHVLEIVGRGVITRLSELERTRRGLS
jgi:hypothetical protein